jgi:outer membrane protein OmpA-like peptidoglycan-associated protein
MTRHPIRHLLLLIVAGPALAACAAGTAPPREPVARQITAPPGQALQVRVPPGTTYVTPPTTDPNTTYVVQIPQDTRALEATRAALARAQQELAATRQALAKGTGNLDELRARERELAQREAELAAQREQAQRERDTALARLGEIEKLKTDQRGLVISVGGTVMFRHDDATLLPEARARLDRIADALKQMAPDQKIVIEGHTDALGTDEYNDRLSENRANAVRSYLLQRGVAADRVVAVGRGEKEPIAPNQTAEGRANNRRVEIVISPSKTPSAG